MALPDCGAFPTTPPTELCGGPPPIRTRPPPRLMPPGPLRSDFLMMPVTSMIVPSCALISLLNEIKAHEGTIIEVTGIIKKSDLNGPGGISLGGGRVRIGGGPPQSSVGGVVGNAPQSGNAILDVEGWRPLGESCPH